MKKIAILASGEGTNAVAPAGDRQRHHQKREGITPFRGGKVILIQRRDPKI